VSQFGLLGVRNNVGSDCRGSTVLVSCRKAIQIMKRRVHRTKAPLNNYKAKAILVTGREGP
jgi:hypothetical protein